MSQFMSNSSAYDLRPVKVQDQEFLSRVYAGTRAEELALTNWDEKQKSSFLQMQYRAQQQQYQLTYPLAADYIIEYQGVPAGQLIVDRSGSETFLVDIALLPHFRNLGLGSFILRDLQAEGNKIILHVMRSNPAANLYQRLGFVFTGEEAFYSQMEWSPTAAQTFPWPGLCIPTYRPARVGKWSLRKENMIAQFGYFQDWEGRGDIDALNFEGQTWMTNARDEVDSQAPHIAAAEGHVVVMGAGMGVALYNLLSKKEVSRVTLVERDPAVMELLQLSAGYEFWRGIEKLRVEIVDALEYRPESQVDHVYADIWATPGEPQSIPDMQKIQTNTRARQTGWWGQELLFLDWLKGETPTLENYREWAGGLGLPLIEQNNPAYPAAVAQVSRSYCYRMFQNDPARSKSAAQVQAQ
jgi:ribosomal protein S18 acetylase RimI-like enzyme